MTFYQTAIKELVGIIDTNGDLSLAVPLLEEYSRSYNYSVCEMIIDAIRIARMDVDLREAEIRKLK